MAIYLVGFDGKWQERFDEPEDGHGGDGGGGGHGGGH